eukprot:CAMPEP_0170236196 /NCGR_PEP_ID=MMETSP0116_2-20130129/17845_1 /TAXON_ID=400756 /ORGANISM="Durinskia baltica, Strain CSIRO CS-38" /LENGTH=67 /DNA_ID=CAMNT_0010486993 /DNA_START=59 /DNA_END=258 /DNA_ORIENTATION=-
MAGHPCKRRLRGPAGLCTSEDRMLQRLCACSRSSRACAPEGGQGVLRLPARKCACANAMACELDEWR